MLPARKTPDDFRNSLLSINSSVATVPTASSEEYRKSRAAVAAALEPEFLGTTRTLTSAFVYSHISPKEGEIWGTLGLVEKRPTK
jgi:hypothetical protein